METNVKNRIGRDLWGSAAKKNKTEILRLRSVDVGGVARDILQSEDTASRLIQMYYKMYLGRFAFSEEIQHHLACLKQSDLESEIRIAASAECFDNFGSNARMFVSVLWRNISDSAPLTDIDDFVARLEAGSASIDSVVRALFSRPEVAAFRAWRAWTRFTGCLDVPPSNILEAARTGDRRKLIAEICARREYSDTLDTADSGLALATREISNRVRTRLFGTRPAERDVVADVEYLSCCSSIAQLRGWIFDIVDGPLGRSRLYSVVSDSNDDYESARRFGTSPHFYSLLADDELPPSGTARILPDLTFRRARIYASKMCEAFGLSAEMSGIWAERLGVVGNLSALTCEILEGICNTVAFLRATSNEGEINLENPPGYFFCNRSIVDRQPIDSSILGKKTISTTYFYWYDRIGAQDFIENPDNAQGCAGRDALTHRPPAQRFFSTANQGLHEAEFRDMAAAGVDVALPVYFGSPYSGPRHSRSSKEEETSKHIGAFSDLFLHKIIAARELLLREELSPPSIGLFFDTTSLFINAKNWHVAGNTAVGRAWFYETLRNFYSQLPFEHWAYVDGRPLVFIYHQSNFRSPVGDIFSYASKRFAKDFGVAPFFVAAAEQDSVQVCNPQAIDHWLALLQDRRSLDVMASFLASQEAVYGLSGAGREVYEIYTSPNGRVVRAHSLAGAALLDEITACVCLHEKVWQRAPIDRELESFVSRAEMSGRHEHVRAVLQGRDALRGLHAYMLRIWLRSDLPLARLLDHPVVLKASDASASSGDLIDGYVEIFASDAVYQAAGGQEAFFLDYFYRHTTHLIAPPGSRDVDLTELAEKGRRGFVEARIRTEAVLRGIVSHWMWYYLGRGYAGRGDSDFYWTGAIDPMFHGVAAIGPGYDQSAIRTRPTRIADRADGRRYNAVWQNLLSMEPRPSLVHLETWNEFFEGTDICESREFGRQYIDLTRYYADRFHGIVDWSRAEITEPDLQNLPPNIISTSPPPAGEDAMPDSLKDEMRELAAEVRSLAATVRKGQAATPVPENGQLPHDNSLEIYPHSMIAHGLVYEPEVYRSYFDQDAALLQSFVDPTISAKPGCFVDFLGRITKCHFLPSIRHLEGKASTSIPIPGDGFYAETIEYIGLLEALATARTDKFVAAEFGGGWGPWIAAAGVAARRLGKKDVHLIGVEANTGKIEFMKEHLTDNGLRPATPDANAVHNGVHTSCICAAVWVSDGEVQFPDVDPASEYGAAVSQSADAKDYRGVDVRLISVPCYTMDTILRDHEIVDFVHIDIQGAEDAVCESSMAVLKDRARYIFVATHSRRIEGNLVELFRKHGFDLVREKPCRFNHEAPWSGTLEGLTTADGGQTWRNPRYS